MKGKIDLAEVPSLPVKCISYAQGEFTTGCADVMIGKGRDGTLMRLFYPTNLEDIRNIEIDNWSSLHLGEKYSEGIARLYFPYLTSVGTAFINAILEVLVQAVWEAEVADAKFPLVIYSHGLIANRSINNSLCNELASFGFIVAAVEHRDDSASATLTFSPQHEEEWIFYKNLASDEDEFVLRSQQVEIRADECSRALDILSKLNSGAPLVNEFEDSDFDLPSLKGKIDLSNPIVMGHSFGGATTILTLGSDQRFKLGVALDPWMFPIKDKIEQLEAAITQPLLIVAVEKWQTERNLKCLETFVKKKNIEIYTLRQGTHFHLTDLAMICHQYTFLFQKLLECYDPSCSPEVILTVNHVLIKKFIFKHLNMRAEYVKDCEHFLARYKDKFVDKLVSSAKTMIGWDPVPKSYLELLLD